MKNKLFLSILPILSVSLTSCDSMKLYNEHLDDYVFNMKYHDDFKILQLTDIHWGNNTSTTLSKSYLDKLLEEVINHVGKVDLLEITGDLFMLANSYHIGTFIDYFEKKAEEYNFKYTVIWGNHDHHGMYRPDYIADKFSKAPHCYYKENYDNLYGRSNFVINLTEDGTKLTDTKWQIANIDSGASFSETAFSLTRNYDYIHEDQINWWLLEHNKVGKEVPTIAYYHIPQDENQKAWDLIHNGENLYNNFFKLEKFGDNGKEKYASDFIEIGSENNLKAAFMGHAHNIDWTVDYLNVTIGLGVKTGTELYYAHVKADDPDPDVQKALNNAGIAENFDLIGASLVTLDDSLGNFSLEHLYYNERTNGDFIKWVEY